MKIRGLERPIRVLLSVVKRPGLVGAFLSNFIANPTCLLPSALLLLLPVTLLMSTTSTMVVSSTVLPQLALHMLSAT